jgi:hypothetical protein
MLLTIDLIHKQYREWIDELGENYSPEELSHVSEKLRALYVLKTTEGQMRPATAFSLYMIRQEAAKEILEMYSFNETDIQPKSKRVNKQSSIISWCKEHVHEQVTPKQISEIGEISYPTALKYINDRPDLFWKVARGVYEVRDPAEDRKKAKP